MIKPDQDWPRSAPPEPPPMRIGGEGDTIDRQGVRRKADGSLRIVCTETIVNWIAGTLAIAAVIAMVVVVTHG